MATKVASLFAEIGLQDTLTSGLKKAEGSLDKIASKGKSVGDAISKGLGAATKLTLPLTVGLGFGIKAASDFEGALVEVQARTGATAKEMDKVRNAALAMGKSGRSSAHAATEAMLELLTSGQDVNEAVSSLPHVFNLSAAGAIEMGRAADGVTDTLAQFNLGVDEMANVVDSLVKGAAVSSADVGDLLDSLANVGPVAANFGMSVDEVVASLAVLAENGIKGAEAGTQFKSMLTQMNTKEAKAQLDELGVSLTDAEGNFRPLNNVLGDLKKAVEGLPEAEKATVIKTIAGAYGQVALTALLGGVSIETMNQKMRESVGAAETATSMTEGFGNKLNTLKNKIETAVMPVLENLITNSLSPMADELSDTVTNVANWIDANPELANTLTRVLAVVAIGIPAVNILAGAIGAIGTLLGAGGAVLTGLAGLAAALSPVLIALAGIAAVGGLAIGVLAGVGDAAAGVGKLIHGDAELKASEETRMRERQGAFGSLEDQFRNRVAWGDTAGAQSFLTEGRMRLPMPTEYVKAIDEGGKVAAATIATGIKGITIPADKSSFIEAANAMASILSGVRLGVAGGLITGTEGSMIKGKRASGGPVFGGEAYLVGEQGPELFVPQTSGTVVPNSALRGGGGNQIIQLQLDGRTIYEVVMNERGQRRNFREF